MNFEAVLRRYPLPEGEYQRYLRRILPPVDAAQLSTELLVGHSRRILKTPVTGDFSQILRYKGIEAAVSSYAVDDTDMILRQLQGAKSRVSWRVATGVRWDDFLMNEAVAIARLPHSGVRRIGMPNPLLIEGIDGAKSEGAIERYKAFVVIAALQWSQTDKLYVRDVRK